MLNVANWSDNVKWIVQVDAFDNTQSVINALNFSGISYRMVDASDVLEPKKCLNMYKKDECVVFYGSIHLARTIHTTSEWIPGAYFDTYNFDCSFYYPKISKYLLNENYMMLPLGDCIRRIDSLYYYFGNNNNIFIRPNSGKKIFTGQVIHKDDFEKEVNLLLDMGVGLSSSIVLVASPENLIAEWRIVVCNGEPISGSQYMSNSNFCENRFVPPEAILLAAEVGDRYKPDFVYVVDVGLVESTNEMRVIELNSFSCSGLYSCDMNEVVNKVSQAAFLEWYDYQPAN